MKRFLSYILCLIFLFSAFPTAVLARGNQMEADVPVWTEDNVRQYALDYISGREMDRLWSYYDLQIRRYMPPAAFSDFLVEMEFLTGDFISLGSYRCFEVPDEQLKTHVLHLCMEKLDVDMYFTHKNKEDDWEVMALEFVPAEEEIAENTEAQSIDIDYTETAVTIVGSSAYPLEGIFTMPNSASSTQPVPVCIFVHDFGPHDRDLTLGNTKMFKDFAAELAEMGIASVRYDKRTYAYPDYEAETVWDEVVEDALAAIELVKTNSQIDQQKIVVVGLGLGGMLCPRIASQSEGTVTAMIMIGSVPDSLLDFEYSRADEYLATLSDEEADNIRYIVRNFDNYSDSKVLEMTLFGKNAYYYREADKYSQYRIMKKLMLPVFIAQGKRDPVVSENEGRRAYNDEFGRSGFVELETFRGLNHILMNDLTTDASGTPEYEIETHIDKQAARTLANWILHLYQDD